MISLSVATARITADYDTDLPNFDVAETSPENELFRLISETWPDLTVFLPLDDPIFAESGVAMNYEEIIHIAPPQRHYDAIIVIPLAHRIPLP